MSKQIIIHAGYPKTATTTVQQTLYANRDYLLKEHGVLYPSLAICHTNFIKLLFTDNEELFYQRGEVEQRYDLNNKEICISEIKESLSREIDKLAWNKLFISSEYISSLSAAELKSLHEWALNITSDIKIILFTRNPINFSISASQQYLKGGAVLDKIYKAPPLPYFRKTLEKLIYQFGEESIHVQSFEESLDSFDHIVDSIFNSLEITNESTASLPVQIESSNLSMSNLAAQVWNRLNKYSMSEEEKVKLRRTGKMHKILNEISGEKFQLPFSVCQDIYQKSLEDVKWLKRKFGIDYTDKKVLFEKKKIKKINQENLDELSKVIYDLFLTNQRLLAFKNKTIKKNLKQSV